MAPPTQPFYGAGVMPEGKHSSNREACFANGEHTLDVKKPQEEAPLTETLHNGAGGAASLDVCKKLQEKVTEGAFSTCCGSEGAQLWTSAFEWTLDFPLSAVWDTTRDFVNISKWLPTYMSDSALVEGTPQQPGCVRSVVGYQDHIPPAYDKLLEIDEHNHKFKYRILTCHLPLLMGHSPTFHFLAASPTSTLLKFSTQRPPVPNYDEQSYRTFVHELYSGFVSDLIKTLSASASASA